jgi:hypothetical protein
VAFEVPNARSLPASGSPLELAPLTRAILDGVDFDTLVAAEGHGIASQQVAGALGKQWLALHWRHGRAWFEGELGRRWLFATGGGPHIVKMLRYAYNFLTELRPDSEFAGLYSSGLSRINPRIFSPHECCLLGWTSPLPREEVERFFDGQGSFA